MASRVDTFRWDYHELLKSQFKRFNLAIIELPKGDIVELKELSGEIDYLNPK